MPDGNLLVSGDFTSIQGYYRNHFARLNPDGSVDLTFDASPDYVATEILTQQDGKYFLRTGVQLLRYQPNGTQDAAFNIFPRMDSSGEVRQVLLQADGRLLVVGRIRRQGSSSADDRGLQWFNADGTWDTNFSTAIQGVVTAFVQANGQILVGGDFTVPWPDGRTRSRILRLNSDGGLDTSFDPGSGPNAAVSFVWGQPDGKVVINGVAPAVVRERQIGGGYGWWQTTDTNRLCHERNSQRPTSSNSVTS